MSSSEGFVGRQDDRERLHDALAAVAGGRGRAVAVEGEPGIGKSSLLEAALTGTRGLRCDVAWAAADELTQQFPLRVLLDAFGVSGRPSGEHEEVDRCRVEIAAILRGRPGGLLSDGDPVQAASELLVQLVERWCAARPLVLVLDDLQWADDASLAVWLRLTEMVDQLPLLLVAAYRPVPRRPAIEQLRDAGTAILTLGPLTTAETNELLTGLLGDAPDAELSQLAQRAAGNPMYLRELAGSVRTGERPDSLAAALARRLDFLTPDVAEVLRVGSLLGAQFTAADVAVVLDRPVTALEPLVDEAVTAGVLVRASDRLTFRHALIRQALYDGLPNGVRLALHGHAAQALANVGAAPAGVAAQLAAAPDVMDAWTYDWLAAAAAPLANQAPQVADDLLRRAVEALPGGDPRRPGLAASLAGLLLRLGNNADAERYARAAIVPGTDPDRTARMRWTLAYLLMRTGRGPEAGASLAEALGDPDLPAGWRARMLALAAMMRASAGGALDEAEASAREAERLGEAAGDRFAIGCALHALSTVYAVRRDEPGRLACVDRALAVLDDDPDCTDLRLLHLANRMYSLTVLDRMAEAEATLATLRTLAERFGDARLASLHHPAATLYFLVGRWDDALVELDAIADVPEDESLAGMVHGLAALIAARRDERDAAAAHLAAVRNHPLDSPRDRANSLPLLTARAVTAERDAGAAAGLAVLLPLIGDGYANSERHLLLPEMVRMAMAAGDPDTARKATELAVAIADADGTGSRRAAVERCRGLLDSDPQPVLAAADHYRAVGRTSELGQALEDAAVLLAQRGDVPAARKAFAEAVEAYGRLGAAWELRRADARIRPHGIRRGSRGPRRRPRYGWEALSPTERMIAELVAKGRSNPDIAAELLLSRRTVQSHVSHILAKLSAKSRVEIARETVQHAAATR